MGRGIVTAVVLWWAAVIGMPSSPNCPPSVLPNETAGGYAASAVLHGSVVPGAKRAVLSGAVFLTVGRVGSVEPKALRIYRWVRSAAKKTGAPAVLILAVMQVESNYQERARSSRDGYGLMQLTAPTARELGVDRYIPRQNVLGGAAYLAGLLALFHNNIPFAVAAYNAGPRAVIESRGVPPYLETRRYLRRVLRLLRHPADISLFSNTALSAQLHWTTPPDASS